MPDKGDSEMIAAVGFICRNSVSSPARSELIKQVTRAHASRTLEHLTKSPERQRLIDARTATLTRQLLARGYV